MGTKANPGRYDCYAKAEPDEPIFTLRANDPNAAALVWLWATMAEFDDETKTEPEKVKEARRCMRAMIEWAAAKGVKPHGLGTVAMTALVDMIRASNTAMDQIRAAGGYDGPKMRAMTPEQFRLYFAAVPTGENS